MDAEEALAKRFPLLKDLPHERAEDMQPFPGFHHAMFFPAERDFAKPPPPPPPTNTNARLQARWDTIDRAVAQVNENFHYIAQREARRLADLCEQDENDIRELNELDNLPVTGMGGGEGRSTLDLEDLLEVESDGPPERYSLRKGLSFHDIPEADARGPRHMPRKQLELQTLNLIRLALSNMENHASAARQLKDAVRVSVAAETLRRFSESGPAGPSSSTLGTTTDSRMEGYDAEGEAMDISMD